MAGRHGHMPSSVHLIWAGVGVGRWGLGGVVGRWVWEVGLGGKGGGARTCISMIRTISPVAMLYSAEGSSASYTLLTLDISS